MLKFVIVFCLVMGLVVTVIISSYKMVLSGQVSFIKNGQVFGYYQDLFRIMTMGAIKY